MVGDWWAKVRHNQSRFCSLTNFIRLQISLSWQQPFSWQPARCSAPLSFSWPEYECQSEEETEHSSGPILTLHSTNLTVTNGKDFIFFPFHYECIICQYIKVIMTVLLYYDKVTFYSYHIPKYVQSELHSWCAQWCDLTCVLFTWHIH